MCRQNTARRYSIVNNTDVTIYGLEPAGNPFEICPADTAGGTVLDDGNPLTIPDACQLDTVGGILQSCIAYYLYLSEIEKLENAIQNYA